jgi:serine/threonine-protein kinase RsbT
MQPQKRDSLPIREQSDVVSARQKARLWAAELKFSLVDQTKLVTAVSELARNTLEHGQGGTMSVFVVENGIKQGLRIEFVDQGPGIPNISEALKDGFSTGSGMGLGLGGSKRLVNEFEIESAPGKGTKIAITRWR